ncbi:MAG: hypothetical protein ACREIA_25365 [Opitutaceae bacterium]
MLEIRARPEQAGEGNCRYGKNGDGYSTIGQEDLDFRERSKLAWQVEGCKASS